MRTYLDQSGRCVVLITVLTVLILCAGCTQKTDSQSDVSGGPLKADTAPVKEPETVPLPTWPRPTQQQRPWTRWWWMGSAVDEQNLTRLLTLYQQAGIGGVEICPIYGAKGYEDQFTDFLSPEWMQLLGHTLRQAKDLHIGVDLTMGTGWPFGGPMVTDQTASAGVILKKYQLQNGQLTERLPREPLRYLLAVSDAGERVDITDKVQDRQLEWTAPAGDWTLYALAVKSPVQRVKRAAPGGEGYVLDPYSVSAINTYMNVFDGAFEGYQGPMPRTFFHDSFEYYGATWTTDFFDKFQSRRGYDLRHYIEALFGDGPADIVARVMCDYHTTINELHLDYVRRWTQWCHENRSLSRNQAHGAPANLVDLYAASDIPETEIFRRVDEAQIPMLKFSSSAAHLNGRTLASAESFTWLKEHFQTAPADLKKATDFLFLTGVNHIFFHGIPYSPEEAPWPGWQFYASVNFGPAGGLWHDLPGYNAYVTRCQSILQSGRADNDILLYLPIYDFWQKQEPLHRAFTVHNQDEWLYPSAFYRAAMMLWKNGYTYDAVTDHFIQQSSCRDGKIIINNGAYDVILVPHCELMQPETMEKLLELAREGATILFQDSVPKNVPGLASYMQRRRALHELLKELIPNLEAIDAGRVRLPDACLEMPLEHGTLLVSDMDTLLNKVAVDREHAMDVGIRFVRRSREDGFDYLFVNRSENAFDGWIALGKPAQSAVLLDPLLDDRIGQAALHRTNSGTQVYLQLRPGQSVILRTYTDKTVSGAAWNYVQPAGETVRVEGTWDVDFIDGGPALPQDYQTSQLASWTERDDKEAKRFFGTARYTIEFDAPRQKADSWLLDLGRVHESARVTLNGVYLGTLWAEPFQLRINQAVKPSGNVLEVEVTNLAANRIRDLDRRGVNWKYFYDINLVNVDYRPFDASDWPLFDSGLLGPVQLQPLKSVSVENVPPGKSDGRISLFIIGDSTVHNSGRGILGWGDVIEKSFDPLKVTVRNFARGGRSSRTFLTEGLWDRVMDELKPGDVVMMQFGHNDGGSLNTGRARGSLKGVGNQIQEVVMESTGRTEIVHTYGWYMQKYIKDTKAKGAVPVVLSPVPRSRWRDGQVLRASEDYGRWAKQTAEANGAIFIDLNELVAAEYEQLGPDEVNKRFFLNDHTHTTPAGAKLNADTVVEAIAGLQDLQLCQAIITPDS